MTDETDERRTIVINVAEPSGDVMARALRRFAARLDEETRRRLVATRLRQTCLGYVHAADAQVFAADLRFVETARSSAKAARCFWYAWRADRLLRRLEGER